MEDKAYTEKLNVVLERCIESDKSKILRIIGNYPCPELFVGIIDKWSEKEYINWERAAGRFRYDGCSKINIRPVILENREQIAEERESLKQKYSIDIRDGDRPLFVCLNGTGSNWDNRAICAPELFFDGRHEYNPVNSFQKELISGFLERLYGHGGMRLCDLKNIKVGERFVGGHEFTIRSVWSDCSEFMHAYLIQLKKKEEDTVKEAVEARDEIFRRRDLALRFRESDLFKHLETSPSDIFRLGKFIGELIIGDREKQYNLTIQF